MKPILNPILSCIVLFAIVGSLLVSDYFYYPTQSSFFLYISSAAVVFLITALVFITTKKPININLSLPILVLLAWFAYIILQQLGKSNYQTFQSYYNNRYDPNIDLIGNPDLLVSNNNLAVLSALWSFQNNVLNKLPVNANTPVLFVTKKINGGKNGIIDRQTKYNSAKQKIDCN